MQDPLYRGGTTKSPKKEKPSPYKARSADACITDGQIAWEKQQVFKMQSKSAFTQERTSGRKKNTQTIYTDGSTHEKQNRDPYIFKKTWRSIADFIWSILNNGSVLHKKISWLVLESDFESDIKSKNNSRSMQCLGIDIISKKTSLSILCLWTDIQEDFVIDSVPSNRTS